jgi:UTP--glucose-1-phosphate uridylyltransferase
MLIKTCVFPIAGLGTRFLPITKSVPKEMLPVLNKPLIHYAVLEAQKSGIENFIFVTGKNKEIIQDYFSENYELEEILKKRSQIDILNEFLKEKIHLKNVIYVEQKEPRGLGDAILSVQNHIKEDSFAVILPDDLIANRKEAIAPCLLQLMRLYQKNTQILAVTQISKKQASQYGIIEVQDETLQMMRASKAIEKPQKNELLNKENFWGIVGRYILQKEIFNILSQKTQNSNKEVQLTDSIQTLAENYPLFGYAFDGVRFDCGTKKGWFLANQYYFSHSKIL